MSLDAFLEKIQNNDEIGFDETIAVITENYHYRPTEFSNGLDDQVVINKAGTNEGSCKIFAFARLHELDQQQTLNLFGDFYRRDVLSDSQGTGHQNIRNFMRFGWSGISFKEQPLRVK